MNPTASIRFRRLTARLAVVWALLALALALTPFLRGAPTLGLPFSTSGVGGAMVVQSVSPMAAALGVEPADQALAIDGASIHEWLWNDLAGLMAGEPNTYQFRKPDGGVFEVQLEPVWLPALWQRPWSALLRASLILVSCLYVGCGLLVWRLKADRAESWALLLFCCTLSVSLTTGQDTNIATRAHLRTFVNLPFIGATIFHLFTTYPVEPLWIVRRRRLRAVPYVIACVIALLVLLTPALGLPPALMPAVGFYWTVGMSVFCLGVLARERRRLRQGRATDRADVMLLGALVAFAPVIAVMIGQAYFRTALPWYVALLWFLIFPVAVGYGIVRRQLFEIRVVARSSAAYGSATLAITGLFAFLITFADATVRRVNVNPEGTWFQLAFLFFAILVFNPLRNRLQQLVDRVFDRDRAAYRLAVREISEAMVSMLSLKEIGDRILVALTDTMGVERAMVMLLDEEQRVLEPSASRGDWDREALQAEIPADHPIIHYLLARRSLSRLDFDDEADSESARGVPRRLRHPRDRAARPHRLRPRAARRDRRRPQALGRPLRRRRPPAAADPRQPERDRHRERQGLRRDRRAELDPRGARRAAYARAAARRRRSSSRARRWRRSASSSRALPTSSTTRSGSSTRTSSSSRSRRARSPRRPRKPRVAPRARGHARSSSSGAAKAPPASRRSSKTSGPSRGWTRRSSRRSTSTTASSGRSR